ncbi:DNA-directed RNA polymerase III subunit rpc5-like [Raphanus sativus]|uniref:DNA-directed RNA polymerase III subunit rpc5-like n=1 Tax=Raphanus sativus TaxID=3726 RepID=A0A9W3BUL9_RAPSA|nr:DNA-directed RNA polymerase III subunit rpc5-like [Raphanus sativus]
MTKKNKKMSQRPVGLHLVVPGSPNLTPTPVHPSQTDAPSESVSKKKKTLMEEEEEEEDVVVREIDVFYNPSIGANTELYVLQYPLRPSWRAYEMDERCQEVRVNPSTSEVEIDLSMDVHSTNYDSKSASELHITKQTLTTTWKPPPKLDYAIGVLSGDKLHLNPVHAVPQLRPSMKYLSSKRKQAEAPEESARTSKKQNKVVQASKDQKPLLHEENWVSLKYHGLESDSHSRYLTNMMASENSTIDFNMSREAYINSLCRGESSRNSKR